MQMIYRGRGKLAVLTNNVNTRVVEHFMYIYALLADHESKTLLSIIFIVGV